MIAEPTRLPWERAREWWNANRSDGQSFETLLGRYISSGHYVWSSPTEFILAAEVSRRIGNDEPEPGCPNAWFIHLAATADGVGLDPKAFMRLAPRAHRWVFFERRGRLRVHRWSQFAGRQTALPTHSYGHAR